MDVSWPWRRYALYWVAPVISVSKIVSKAREHGRAQNFYRWQSYSHQHRRRCGHHSHITTYLYVDSVVKPKVACCRQLSLSSQIMWMPIGQFIHSIHLYSCHLWVERYKLQLFDVATRWTFTCSDTLSFVSWWRRCEEEIITSHSPV